MQIDTSSNENLSLSDISLVPKVISSVTSRNDVMLDFICNDSNYTLPIIASPMKDVCDGKVALEMNRLGGLGIIHRFSSIEQQVKEFNIAGPNAFCAIGVNGDCIDRCNALQKAGCKLFCIDVANGASVLVEKILKTFTELSFIVGNVASKECFSWLDKFENVVKKTSLLVLQKLLKKDTSIQSEYLDSIVKEVTAK